jgi:hypothetical protein
MYLRNNVQFLFFIIVFVVLINVALFVARAYYFRNFKMLEGWAPNPFYMMSRANGECVSRFAQTWPLGRSLIYLLMP